MKKSEPTLRRSPAKKRPFVFVNFAMTADGKTAFADHRFIPFSSRRDHEHMLELRATADAVICGARTVDMNAVTLGTGGTKYEKSRLKHGLARHHLRILVSGSGTVNPRAEIFQHRFSPIIILTTRRAGPRLTELRKLAEVKICGQDEIDFPAAFRWLRDKWKVKRLLCEGGGELNGALARAGLVDELHLTLCPKVFGGRTSPTIAEGEGLPKLSQAKAFQIKSMKQIGDELFAVFGAAR